MNRRQIIGVLVVLSTLVLALWACGGGTPQETNTSYDEQPAPQPQPAPEPVAQPEPPPPAPEPPPAPQPPPVITADQAFEGLQSPPPPAAWLTCTADADCTVVEVGCCDHCNGGRVVSVVTKQAKAATKRYKPRRCTETCTERGCAAAEAVCQEGRCAHRAPWMVGAENAPAPSPAPAATPANP